MATRDGCCAMKRRAAMVIAFLLVGMGAAASVTQGHATVDDCAPGDPLTPKAEMFATNNTETIADPADPRLQDRLEPFASQVDGTILANSALPVGSDRMQGVFWSEDLQRLTFESSRQFHLACVGEAELTRIAEMVAGQFDQESVLTFTYQPGDVTSADSFIAEVPGVDVQRFHDALATDPDARTRLGGGSITARAGSCPSASGQRSRRTAAATAPPSRQGPSACLW
jgi:hypothetical protein